MKTACRRWLRVVLVALLLLALAFTGWRVTLRVLINRELTAIRAQGLPVTLAELDAFYPAVPDHENAATLYQRAFEALVAPERSVSSWLPIVGSAHLARGNYAIGIETSAVIQAHLVANAEASRLLVEARERFRCRHVLPGSVEAPIPVLQRAGQATRLLTLQAWWDAKTSEGHHVAQWLAAALGLADTLRECPLSSFQTTRANLVVTTLRVLERILESTKLTDSTYAALDEALAKAEAAAFCEQVVAGDRVAVHEYFLHARQPPKLKFKLLMMDEPATLLETPAFLHLYRFTGLLDRDHLTYLRATSRMAPICALPWQNHREAVDQIWGELYASRPPVILAEKGYFGTRRGMAKIVSTTALVRTARFAIAVERERSSRDSSAVPPAFALAASSSAHIDPFTGEPLRYKLLSQGYVVYSVGENGVDHGGDEGKDITFTVAR